jgi:hypothetical protein
MSTIQKIDELNAALDSAEWAFRGVAWTATASILVDHEEVDVEDLVFGFKKMEGGWSFYFVRDGTMDPPQKFVCASLAERIAMAHALPQLWQALESAQLEQTQRIENATHAARQFTEMVRHGK